MDTQTPSWFVLSQKGTANLERSGLIPSLVFTFLALIIVPLRFYSRVRLAPGRWHIEDFFIAAALLLSIGHTVCVGVKLSIDTSPADDEQSAIARLSGTLKLVFAEALLYQFGVNLVKTAFVLQYLRIFSHLYYFKYYCYVIFLLILGATAWGMFGLVFLCSPVRSQWDLKVHGRCMDVELHFLSSSVVGIVLDWAIWVLPMPIMRRLRLPRRQKWGLWGLFGLGGFVCVVSILRFTIVHQATRKGELIKSGTYAVTWATIEVNSAIICASLLVMKPLFARWMPAIVSEQPVSASQDKRAMRRLTGLAILNGGLVDEENAVGQEQRRADTGVAGFSCEHRSEDSQVLPRIEVLRSAGTDSSTTSDR